MRKYKRCQAQLGRADDIDKPLLSAKEPEISRTSGPGEKRGSRKIVSRGLGRHQMLLISDMGRRGPLGDKGQFEVVDDAVDLSILKSWNKTPVDIAFFCRRTG